MTITFALFAFGLAAGLGALFTIGGINAHRELAHLAELHERFDR
ncbi:hypothetical protein [Gryllotalpicola kribbensis]